VGVFPPPRHGGWPPDRDPLHTHPVRGIRHDFGRTVPHLRASLRRRTPRTARHAGRAIRSRGLALAVPAAAVVGGRVRAPGQPGNHAVFRTRAGSNRCRARVCLDCVSPWSIGSQQRGPVLSHHERSRCERRAASGLSRQPTRRSGTVPIHETNRPAIAPPEPGPCLFRNAARSLRIPRPIQEAPSSHSSWRCTSGSTTPASWPFRIWLTAWKNTADASA
jgi:hypothetical protein